MHLHLHLHLHLHTASACRETRTDSHRTDTAVHQQRHWYGTRVAPVRSVRWSLRRPAPDDLAVLRCPWTCSSLSPQPISFLLLTTKASCAPLSAIVHSSRDVLSCVRNPAICIARCSTFAGGVVLSCLVPRLLAAPSVFGCLPCLPCPALRGASLALS